MTQPLPPGHGTPAALPDAALPAELPDAALPAEQPDAALPAELPDGALPAELRAVIEAVHGVTAVYPARPLWQTIAGAARSAVTGEAPPAVDVIDSGAGATPSGLAGVDDEWCSAKLVSTSLGFTCITLMLCCRSSTLQHSVIACRANLLAQ